MYTIAQAVDATGKSKSTLLRAIKKGKISASKDENGHNLIDPAELHRVYPKVSMTQSNDTPVTQDDTPSDTPQKSTPDSTELATLRAENELLKKMVSTGEETIDDLRDRLDKSDEERIKSDARLTALLTDQREDNAPVKRGLFSRLTGR